LHEANTKQQAAASSLIYGDRPRAITLLDEADQISQELASSNLYINETSSLQAKIREQRDRASRIWRIPEQEVSVVGDFAALLKDQKPTRLFLVNNTLFTYNPADNAILKMSLEGAAEQALATTQGIGFFTGGVVHDADKQIVLLTDTPGVALFDVTTNELTSQDITFPSATSSVKGMAVYGSRLYVFDETSRNVYTYTKTLRGYTNSAPWLKNQEGLGESVVSMAVDGSVYLLEQGGVIKEFFKGEIAPLTVEKIQPPLTHATALLTTAELNYLYVVDAASKRVAIFDKKGGLHQQLYFPSEEPLIDVAVSGDEQTLFALLGTQVVRVSLVHEGEATGP
jgi:hypothetical protein